MGDNSDDFVSNRGEPTTNRDKSTLPEGWHAKRAMARRKAQSAVKTAFKLFNEDSVRFACHSRLWGFLRWVFVENSRSTPNFAIRTLSFHQYNLE